MAIEWFVENDGRPTGPFTVAQMKAQATAHKITANTRVRRGKRGKWVAARQVKGLLRQVPKQAAEPSHDEKLVAKASDAEGIFLAPLRNQKRRLIVFGCLAAFILIGRAPLHQQLFFDLTMGLMIGSYPIVEIKKKSIEKTLMIFFYPAHKTIYKLRDYVGVETAVESRLTDSVGCLVIFIFWYWFLFRLFDHLIPWLGGNYKLQMRRYDDELTLIWQGNNVHDFEANLEALQAAGLPLG